MVRNAHFLALAACCALLLGVGAYTLQNRPAPIPPVVAQTSPEPTESLPIETVLPTPTQEDADPITLSATDTGSFPLFGQETGNGLFPNFYSMPALNFVDVTNTPEPASCIAVPEGSFDVKLNLEDLQRLFWGPQGKPETLEPDTDLPWSLYWGGCTVWAWAIYDGTGELWMLTIYGEREGDSFKLTLSPGRLPPTCLAEPGEADSVTVNAVPVSSRLREYDRNGDGRNEVTCTSEFLTDTYGCRFENVGAPQMAGETYDREATIYFNTLFVRYALSDEGLYLGHIAHTDAIPAPTTAAPGNA